MGYTTQIVLLQQDYITTTPKQMANFQCAMFIDILKVLLRIIFMHIIYVLHSVYECMFMNKKPKGFTARSDLLLCQAS